MTDSFVRDIELAPYRMLFEQGYAGAVMANHLVNRSLDPSALSALLALRRQRGRWRRHGERRPDLGRSRPAPRARGDAAETTRSLSGSLFLQVASVWRAMVARVACDRLHISHRGDLSGSGG